MKQPLSASFGSIGYYLITGSILAIPALVNNYPFVYSDSATYILGSRTLLPATDRPMGYGFLMRAVTWQSSLWPMILFQAAVGSWLVREVLRSIFPEARDAWRPHVLVLFLLLLCSSLPWYTSQLMPDVFAGMLPICVFLVLFGRGMGRTKLLLLWLLLFFFTLTHFSYMALLLPLGAMTWAMTRWMLERKARGLFRARIFVGLIVVPVMAILISMGYNARHGLGFTLSPTSSLFLSAKLIESGVMRTYLERNCADDRYALCDDIQALHGSAMRFVWDDNSPTRQRQDMVTCSAQLAPLVNDLLKDPTMWPSLIWTSCFATAVQTFQLTIGSGLEPYREGSAPYEMIKARYPQEFTSFAGSWQQRHAWDFHFINNLTTPLFLVALGYLLAAWPERSRVRIRAFLKIMLLGVVLNAAATGALANIYDRLQARITWLIILAAILLLIHNLPRLRRMLFGSSVLRHGPSLHVGPAGHIR